MLLRPSIIAFLIFLTLCVNAGTLLAQNRIGDICRIKGQETNTLRGVGLVVGLQGTGDPNLATTGRMTSEALASSGLEIPRDANGNPLTEVYKDNKNTALVFVIATVPAEGARQGSELDVKVMAWDKTSSLAGGYLLETALTGGPMIDSEGTQGTSAGRAANLPVLAMAEGAIRLEGDVQTVGRVSNGAQLQVDFQNQFFEQVTEYVSATDQMGSPVTKERVNRYLNLVLRRGHANFGTAADVAERINNEINNLITKQGLAIGDPNENIYAQAIDSVNIRVRFADAYLESPVEFARFIQDITVLTNNRSDKIVINSRTNVITIGEDVYFSPVAVTSGDFKVDVAPFKELTLDDSTGIGNDLMKLKRLVQALNDIQAPPRTVIDVIKNLDEGGHIYGQVIEL